MSVQAEKPLRILLIEDHPDQAELTRRTVERQLRGAEVTVADRGEACLERLAGASYDLLLLDYSLPDMSGIELLREVKAREHHLPVVMVTGQGDERIAVEAMKGGAADYLIKTGGYLTALPAVIQKVLQQAELQKNLAAAQAEVLQRNRELTDLHTLASTLSTSLRLADLLPLALEVIVASVEAECGGVYLVPTEGDGLTRAVHRGLPATAKKCFPERVREGEGVIGSAFLEGKAIFLNDPSHPDLAGSGLTRLAVIPLVAKGRHLGLMVVGCARTDAPSPERRRLLELMGNHLSVAVENARLFERAEHRARGLAALNDVSRQITAAWRLEDLLPRIAESAAWLLRIEAAGFRLLEGDEMVVAATAGEADQIMTTPRLKVGESLSGWVITEGQPISLPDIEGAPDRVASLKARAETAEFSSALSVPLRAGDQAIGALCVFSRARREFTEEDISLISTFADQAAIAIENARLYKETARALEDLQRTQGQLIQTEKLRALGEMAGGVAHDFNNILAIILGRAQYLSLRQGDLSPEEVRRSLGIVERAALDGADTVRRLMNFTRATPRQQEAEAVDPDEILDYVADASRPRWKDEVEARGKQVQMVIERGNAPLVTGNAAELREVVLNLVFNAVEAMPGGGRLTLKNWSDGGNVYLSVQDTGVGMPEEVARKIFDPFFTTKGPQRSGLGLSVSYGIIRRHQGEITVESWPGRGTTFTIRLPVGSVPIHRVEAPPEPLRSRLRILVVDDDHEVREMLLDILKNAGHTVLEAKGGAEALEILEREGVDLVCTDLGMPGMSGWEVADRAKSLRPALKVALITGWGSGIESEDLESHGVDLLIAKPFQVKEILQSLDGVYAGNGTRGRSG